MKGGVMNPEPYRFDLVPPRVLMEMAVVMAEGLKDHPEGGWREIPTPVHVGRAMGHLVRWMQGDPSGGNHLAHAACRLAFAIEQSPLAPLTSLEGILGDPAPDIAEAPRVQPQGWSGGPLAAPEPRWWGVGGSELLVRKSSPFVYLAHPSSGIEANRLAATQLGDKLQYQLNQERESGEWTFVVIPHNFCLHLSEEVDRPLIMEMCKAMVGMCRHLYLGGGVMTPGMKEELQEARRLGIPVSVVHDHGNSLGFSGLEGEE